MKNYRLKNLILMALLVCFSMSVLAQGRKKNEKSMDEMWGETRVSVDALKAGRGKLFDESNFGMFIHWGLFSNLGGKWKDKTYYGIGEWIMNPRVAGIPVDEYIANAKDFNPKEFDAKKIAQLAKDAGMKYIIITSKHHEGFAMFDSKADPFNIVAATPFARDPMKELSAACHELGLGFGFYYSHNQDWTTPGGSGGPKNFADGKPATFEDYYYKKCLPQVKEICTNYGPIDFVWFDTPGDMKKELVIELAKTVRQLQPNAMLCSRIGHGMGDYASKGDMEVPPANIEGLWETCDTNNDSWSYAWYDNNFKSPKEILNRLIATVGRGGTYLFNVGPNGLGVVSEIGAKFLRETGKWIRKYPQVVYNSGCSPFGHALPWGDVTTKGNSMFLSVFDWPQDGKLYLPGFSGKIVSTEILGGKTPKSVTSEQVNGWTVFKVPYRPADPLVSVIEVKLESDAQSQKVNTSQAIYPNIEASLLCAFAKVKDAEQKEKKWMEKFGEWKHVNQVTNWGKGGQVEWAVEVFKPGYYYIDLKYSGVGRLVWKTVTDEGVTIQNQQPATEKYQSYPMGIIQFKKAGKHTITVSLVEGDPKTSSLESIIIKPII